jgi:hypothetical protein
MSQTPVNPFDPNANTATATAEAPTQPGPGPAFPTGPIPGGPAITLPTAAANSGPEIGGPQVGGPLPGGMPGGIPADGEQVIDLTGVKAGGRDQIDVGRYLGYCSSVNPFDTSKSSDNPMVTFTFTVMAGPMAGRSRKLYCALTPDALFKLLETLTALGITDQKPTKNMIAQLAPGRVVLMNVIQGKPYNGNPTTDFNRVEAPTEFGFAAGTTREQVMADPRAQAAGAQ